MSACRCLTQQPLPHEGHCCLKDGWNPAALAACGWAVLVETARPSDTATTTSDLSYALVNDAPTQVWTVRLKTQDELDIDTATSNRSQLQSKAEQALSINVTYLSLTTPTTAQNTAQIKALTRQVSAVIRLLLQKLDNLAGT